MATTDPGLTCSSIPNKTVIFIDSRVADHPTLIAGLGADCEPVWLDDARDGLKQMRAAVAGWCDLASIRILARSRLRARHGRRLRRRGLGFVSAGGSCRPRGKPRQIGRAHV